MSGDNAADNSLDDGGRSFGSGGFGSMAPISDDWYHGHKVVAMPSSAFGGMSIKEVVSSRNESEQSYGLNNRHRRSNSLGRQPVRPGRDIIQDVYDRMGVSYTRGVNYETTTPPRNASTNATSNAPTGEYEVPTGMIQTTPSFSEVSDFSTNSSTFANNITSGGQPPPAATSRLPSSAAKIKDKFSGRYRAAAAMTRNTPDRARSRPPGDPALQNRGRATEPRGRTADPCLEEQESEGRRRARSLSRGLSVRGMWPPKQTDQGGGAPIMDNTPVSKVPPNNKNPQTVDSGRNHIQPQVPQPLQQQPPPPPQQQPNSPTNHSKSPMKRSHSFDARPQYGGGLRASSATMYGGKIRTTTAPNTQDTMMSASIRDEKKEGDDRSTANSDASGTEEGSAPSAPIPSIKDRISAFAGKSTNSSSQRGGHGRRNTYAATTSYNMKPAAPPPPKVDIYSRSNDEMTAGAYPYHPDDPYLDDAGNEVVAEDYSQQQHLGPPEPSSAPPSLAATTAAEAAAKYMRPSQVVKQKAASRHSTGSVTRSSIANSYLNGIQSSTSNATSTTSTSSRSGYQQSMMDGSASNSNLDDRDHQGGGYNGGQPSSSDINSVGSYGADSGSASRRGSSWQKQGSYNTPNKIYSASSGGGGGPCSGGSGSENISMEMIEKMVDERVQVQLREVEARMEGLLRRWMDSMNNKITSRLDAMERSIKDSLPRHEI